MSGIFGPKTNFSSRSLILVGLIFVVCLIVLGGFAYGFAYRTRQQMLANQQVNYTPPTTPTKKQIKRILLRYSSAAGVQYLEILANGTINLYDQNMKLLKSGLRGFGQVNSLFDDITKNWDYWKDHMLGNGNYTLIIDTNTGQYTFVITGGGVTGGSGGSNPVDDLIGGLIDLGNDTFTPTPTPHPTPTPPIHPPTPTPTPETYPTMTPDPNVTPNPLTPTPLPGYVTAPPFKCEDYKSDHPFIISNIICGLDK